jgi:carbon-monoxide dehydrogenase medium subunit
VRPIPSFKLHRPHTIAEALKLLQELENSKPIAGGSDLLLDLKSGVCAAEHLIDLKGVRELNYIKEVDGVIHIGAATTHEQLVSLELIREKAPVLSQAASLVGSVQTRNWATVGGNLCNASPGADTATPLLVLGAEVEIASKRGNRTIPLRALFSDAKRNSLDRDELLTEIRFPVPPSASGASFQKLGRRKGSTLSIINAAAYLQKDGVNCTEARVAFGACAPTPVRINTVEEMLKGKKIDESLIDGVSSACYDLVQPSRRVHSRASEEYRRAMSCVLIKRALEEAHLRTGVNQ